LKQPKQTEFCQNKLKKTQKNVLYLGVLETVNFFSWLEPKQTETQSVSVVFGLLFRKTPQKNFRFVSMFRTGIKTTKTNRTYGMGNEKG
jgi:inhibitor of KinA sporulation pathway (predicted exonuclease)